MPTPEDPHRDERDRRIRLLPRRASGPSDFAAGKRPTILAVGAPRPVVSIFLLSCTVVLALAAAAMPAARAQILEHRETRDVFTTTSEPGDYRATMLVTRVIDAETRQPVPGARMAVVDEQAPWLGGEGTVRARAVADEDGWVRLDVSTLDERSWSWIFFDAAGYAPHAENARWVEPETELLRGRDLTVRCVDRRHRPIADLELELLIGCGHTPAPRTARTDALGLATLRDVHPDPFGICEVWPRGGGVNPDAVVWEEAPASLAGCAPWLLELERRAPTVGVVRDERDRPIVGAVVGVEGHHRGPWVLTDAGGRFELPLDRDFFTRYTVSAPGRNPYEVRAEGRNEIAVPPAGQRRLIRLDADGVVVRPRTERPLTVRVLAGDSPVSDVELRFVRLEDGLTVAARSDADGRSSAMIHEGDAWRVLAHDALLRWETHDRELTADELEAGKAELELVARPTRSVTLETPVDEPPWKVLLISDLGTVDFWNGSFEFVGIHVDDETGEARDRFVADLPHLPAEADPVLRIVSSRHGASEDVFFDLPATAEPVRIVLRRPPMVTVSALLDAHGEPLPARFFLCHALLVAEAELAHDPGAHDPDDDEEDPEIEDVAGEDPGAAATLAARIPLPDRHASLWLVALPEDEDLEALCVPLSEARRVARRPQGEALEVRTLEPRGGPPSDLAFDVLRHSGYRRPEIHVERTDEYPSGESWISCGDVQIGRFDDRGTWRPRVLTARELQDRVLTFHDPFIDDHDGDTAVRLPLSARLVGGPPWHFAWPTGVAALRVQPSREGRELHVLLDGETLDLDGHGHLRILGVAPGRHRLTIATRGCFTHVVTFEMGDDELDVPISWTPLD